jgi:hypothetical protein
MIATCLSRKLKALVGRQLKAFQLVLKTKKKLDLLNQEKGNPDFS